MQISSANLNCSMFSSKGLVNNLGEGEQGKHREFENPLHRENYTKLFTENGDFQNFAKNTGNLCLLKL